MKLKIGSCLFLSIEEIVARRSSIDKCDFFTCLFIPNKIYAFRRVTCITRCEVENFKLCVESPVLRCEVEILSFA
jgi:hypothetical protein